MMELDLTSFEKAIAQLELSLKYCDSDLAKNDPGLALQLRAAAIQSFEFTYELAWKMLKRYLEKVDPNPSMIDTISFSDLIRTGNERGLLLSNLKTWNMYRQNRNITSYTYNEVHAEKIFSKLPQFLEEVQFLIKKLQEKTGKIIEKQKKLLSKIF